MSPDQLPEGVSSRAPASFSGVQQEKVDRPLL